MIKVILSGRLGNIFFQYAVGRQLSIKCGTSLLLDFSENYQRTDKFARTSETALRSLRIRAEIHNPIPLTVIHKLIEKTGIEVIGRRTGEFSQTGFVFNPEALQLEDGAVLRGYFQSEKYFFNIRETIRDELKPKQDLAGSDVLKYQEEMERQNSVSIHVRRTDYLKYDIHNILGLPYYARAISYFLERMEGIHFYLFSDDLQWCRRNFLDERIDFVDLEVSKRNPLPDLILMQSCKHHIISNSTYAWWGAWLDGNPEKTVLAPNRWIQTNNEGMNRRILQDIYPSQWTLIEAV